MRILITGGAGFIGSKLSLALARRGDAVTILDSLSSQIHGNDPTNTSELYRSVRSEAAVIVGSVCDRDALVRALHGQDAVVHLAAETGTGQSMYEIERYCAANIGGTALLADVLANSKHSVQKVLVASSRAIHGEGKYFSKALGVIFPVQRHDVDLRAGRFDLLCPATGNTLQLLATDEDAKIHPRSVYGITKQTQEQLVMTVCASLGLAASALRYQNVYGPGQSLSNPYTGILSIFSTRILNGHSLNIFEDGLESRDFVYIDDVVRATIAALDQESASGEVFAIGSGVPTSVLQVARVLCEHFSSDVPVQVSGAYRVGDIRHNFADIAKARRILHFSPEVTFHDGIRRFTEWVKTQQIRSDSYDQSISEMRARGIFKG